jgi:hypothetical protein
MAVIISTLGLTPAIVRKMMDELQKRGVNVREVHVVTTKGAVIELEGEEDSMSWAMALRWGLCNASSYGHG